MRERRPVDLGHLRHQRLARGHGELMTADIERRRLDVDDVEPPQHQREWIDRGVAVHVGDAERAEGFAAEPVEHADIAILGRQRVAALVEVTPDLRIDLLGFADGELERTGVDVRGRHHGVIALGQRRRDP